MWFNQSVSAAFDFYSVEKHTMEVNRDQKQFGDQHSEKYILCSTEDWRFGTT